MATELAGACERLQTRQRCRAARIRSCAMRPRVCYGARMTQRAADDEPSASKRGVDDMPAGRRRLRRDDKRGTETQGQLRSEAVQGPEVGIRALYAQMDWQHLFGGFFKG